MRSKLKYIFIAGIALAIVEGVFKFSSPRSLFRFGSVLEVQPLPVQAKETTRTASAVPPPADSAENRWSTQMGAVLTSENSPTAKAITLLELFPNLPPQAQLEAAQHTSHLLADDYYGALGAQLTNAMITPAARRVIFADLLTRRPTVKLPWLVAVASADLEGESAEALALLKTVLREDYGTDWALWRERTAVWLTMHPE